MGNAFPLRPDCDVPVVPAIGKIVPDFTFCTPPAPISAFPWYEFPPPDPPSFNDGCYAPTAVATLRSGDPDFSARVRYPNPETGTCEPEFEIDITIPSVCGVRAATTDEITLADLQTIDDVALGVGDHVLVKDQSDASQNGVYAAQHGSWVRVCTSLSSGGTVNVRSGGGNGGTVWMLTTEGEIVLGTTPLTFQQTGGRSCCCFARVATTENLDDLNGLQTVDGVALAENDIVLVKDQDDKTENGTYLVREETDIKDKKRENYQWA